MHYRALGFRALATRTSPRATNAPTPLNRARFPGRYLVPQLDREWDAGVEPVAVHRLDLLAGREAAHMQRALVVVGQVDRLADRLPRLFELTRVLDLARDAGIGAAPEP